MTDQVSIPQRGYIARFQIKDVPIWIHWSFPIGGLFLVFFLGGGNIERAITLVVAYTTLVLVHEFGHAMAAWSVRAKVNGILVVGAGGWCLFEKPEGRKSMLLIAAGGILAQLALLAGSVTIVAAVGFPSSEMLSIVLAVFIYVNALLMVVNILPVGLSDGKHIVGLLFRNRHA